MLSTPPVCTSKRSPRYFVLIAEHSMCQPGNPDAQPALVLSECRLVELRDLHRGLALRECRRDDLVLAAVDGVLPHVPDVGDVLDGDDAVSEELERAPEPIGEQIRAKIPDVDGSVDRRSTGVHADLARVGRYDRLHAPRQRVVKTYLHAASPVE